jgi:TonB-like protein
MSSVLDVLPTRPSLTLVKRPAVSFTLREIGYGYRPGGSFGVSVLLHGLACMVILFVARHAFISSPVFVQPKLDTNQAENILILPPLGGGEEGSGLEGGGQGSASSPSSGMRAQSRRGFAYPGLQPMVSNPPKATLGVQTIMQPSLENLPQLKRLVELPNIIQPAPPAAPQQQAPLVVKTERIAAPAPTERSVAAPKITIPTSGADKLDSLMQPTAALPERAVPDAIEASEIPHVATNQAGLLVLNAVPPPPDVQGVLPKGEARSLFAVSPAEVTVIADPGAGTKLGASHSVATGSGDRTEIVRGDALADAASGGRGGDPILSASGSGRGGRYGDAHGMGVNAVSKGAANGRGSGSGKGLGIGIVGGGGSGHGAGSAPGAGGFPGITIQGGRYGNSGNMVARSEPHRQTSYGMTIESTPGSGGLPDFGVFRNEKVYTVYLDMRSDADDHTTPSWTLQYAVLQPAATPGDAPARILGTPTPPYAVLKEVPQFAPDQIGRTGHPLIVASAILNTGGKLEEVSVKQSSEESLIGPLLEALKNWVFEPAKINGQPVALKVLLGIRLPRSR